MKLYNCAELGFLCLSASLMSYEANEVITASMAVLSVFVRTQVIHVVQLPIAQQTVFESRKSHLHFSKVRISESLRFSFYLFIVFSHQLLKF